MNIKFSFSLIFIIELKRERGTYNLPPSNINYKKSASLNNEIYTMVHFIYHLLLKAGKF